MENEEIKEQIQRALDCVGGLDGPYREVAFRVVLERLLREEGGLGKELSTRIEAPLQESFPPINEFYSSLHLKAYTDGVIAIGYYLLHAEKITLFTIQDIADRLSKCRAERPKNLSDVLAGCARNGWLAEGNEKHGGMKSWYLTSTGEKYFEVKLNKVERTSR
jgi:hypothetical protein